MKKKLPTIFITLILSCCLLFSCSLICSADDWNIPITFPDVESGITPGSNIDTQVSRALSYPYTSIWHATYLNGSTYYAYTVYLGSNYPQIITHDKGLCVVSSSFTAVSLISQRINNSSLNYLSVNTSSALSYENVYAGYVTIKPQSSASNPANPRLKYIPGIDNTWTYCGGSPALKMYQNTQSYVEGAGGVSWPPYDYFSDANNYYLFYGEALSDTSDVVPEMGVDFGNTDGDDGNLGIRIGTSDKQLKVGYLNQLIEATDVDGTLPEPIKVHIFNKDVSVVDPQKMSDLFERVAWLQPVCIGSLFAGIYFLCWRFVKKIIEGVGG